ncbi:hypothetical protein ACLQ3C_21330 [Gordonia sp. DT30]|uniref:hypothetical protein n=1 Tax=unclassified Gordonia (in: high G+C Gram-positive bacteria) TaxID=2657482 RepID=UPI003CEB6AC9
MGIYQDICRAMSRPLRPRCCSKAAGWDRERDFFHAFERELPVERGGLFAVNAVYAGDRTTDEFDILERMFEALDSTANFWESARWVPVCADHMPAMRIRTAEDIRNVAAWFTSPMALQGAWNPRRDIRVVNAAPSGVTDGAVELVFRITADEEGGLDQLGVTVNIERPEVLDDSGDGRHPSVEAAVGSVLHAVVVGLQPDVASASGGAALLACNAFGVDVEGYGARSPLSRAGSRTWVPG